MSSGLDNVSDDDADQDAPRDKDGRQAIRHSAERDMGSPPESEGAEDRHGQSSNEGLNPWSIAKLASSANRRTSPRRERVVREIRRPEAEAHIQQQSGIEAASGPASEGLPPRRGPLPPRGGYERPENPAARYGGARPASHELLRTSPLLPTWEQNQQSRSRHKHGLQTPPTSSPHEYAPTGRRSTQRHPQQAGVPGRLAQSQISFGRKTGRQKQHQSTHADPVRSRERVMPPQPSQHTRASTVASRLDVVEGGLMIPELVPAGRGREETSSQTRPFLQPPLRGTNNPGENMTDAPEREEPTEETAQSALQTDDPRAHLIKQRQLMMVHPQRKPKRIKTEQLPLETIPRSFQTRTLLLTVSATRGGLAQLFPAASQFDTWLVDGKLRDAIQDAAGPDDTASLVNSLLSRFGQGGRPSG